MISDRIEQQFHPGELAAQARAGVAPRAAAIRGWMPDQHRTFFAALPFLLAATADGSGAPIATVLTGPPGFVASPDATTLRIAALPDADDPAAEWFKPGAAIGLLGIDLATRRRNRANGVITGVGAGLTVAVENSFGNCAKYIHVRSIAAGSAAAGKPEAMDRLDAPARGAIIAADTLFVATSGGGAGIDISHRGGRPGFVRVVGDTLTIPDFAGNRYFNTLGNMLIDPRAALLFLDFASGDLLGVQGPSEIVWQIPEADRLLGAERLWRVHVAHAWRRRGAVPLRWSLQTLSPSVQETGTW